MPALAVQFERHHATGTMGLGQTGTFSRSPRGLFIELVALAQLAVRNFGEIEAAEHGGRPSFIFGHLNRPSLARFNELVSRFDALGPPLVGHSCGAGTRSRTWLARDVLGARWDQAVTLVDFEPRAAEGTLLADEHSDRMVIVRAGRGILRTSEGTHELHPGTTVLLTRGLTHGIAARGTQSLGLLVCHLPYVEPDDARCSTVAAPSPPERKGALQ